MDHRNWPALKEKLAAVFAGRTRDEWCALLEGSDICFAPVLSLTEARSNLPVVGDALQPAPAPRGEGRGIAIVGKRTRPGLRRVARPCWGRKSAAYRSIKT